jgi:hypothetical protein
MRKTVGYIWTDYKTNKQIANELNSTPVLDRTQEYRRNWLQYTEWPKKMYKLFTHQYLWNKFKSNFYFSWRFKDISASQERLCHLLSKNYKSACAIC